MADKIIQKSICSKLPFNVFLGRTRLFIAFCVDSNDVDFESSVLDEDDDDVDEDADAAATSSRPLIIDVNVFDVQLVVFNEDRLCSISCFDGKYFNLLA
jgi:hypothetical protein